MDHSPGPGTTDTHSATQGSHRSMRSFIQSIPILCRDYAVNQRRFAVHEVSGWPPLERPWTLSPRPTSSQYSFQPSQNLGNASEPHVESSTSSRTPAQQVRDAYMASQGQADDSDLRNSVMSLFAAMQRDGIRTQDIDASQDEQADENQDWAQDYTMPLSSIPFPASSSSGDSEYSRSDGQEDTHLDLGAVLEDAAISVAGSSTLADHSVELLIQNLGPGEIQIQSPWSELHNPGEWIPRRRARRDARATVESTPPGQRLLCPVEGCTRVVDEERSLRVHLLVHYANDPEGEQSTSVISSHSGQHADDVPAQDTWLIDNSMGNTFAGPRTGLQSNNQGLSVPHLRLNLEDHPGLQTALLAANAAITNAQLSLQCPWPGCNASARNAQLLGFHMYLHSLEHDVAEGVLNPSTTTSLSTDPGPDVASSTKRSKKDRRKFRRIRKKLVQVAKLPFARDSAQTL